MKKTFWTIVKIVVILLFVAWVAIVFTDYFRTTNDKKPLFCISEKTKKYDDGDVYTCLGLGYRTFRYNREAIDAIQFGPFFISERDA